MSDLRQEVRDGVTWVRFDRPEARNALTFAMYEELRAVCEGVPGDGSIHALVVTGGRDVFAAGTDMTQFRAFSTPEDAWAYEERVDAVLGAVEACAVPVIAAISGPCTGGGAAIAAACDVRVADPALRFGFPIARTLGNCLSAANLARLSALMGPARVKEMILTARLIGAEEALRIGFVAEVVEDPEARATEIAARLGEHAPLTMRATREAMRRLAASPRAEDRDLIAMCYTSEDFREGMEAFLGKRKPRWTGR